MGKGMKGDRLTGRTRGVALALGCVALVATVAFIDYRSSAYIAFSIFYVVPIAFAAWYGKRTVGVVTAVASGLGGFAADVWATNTHHLFAWVNLGLRLVLFTLVALMIAHIKVTREREQRLAELEREASQRLQELNDMKDALMRSVIVDAREPLGDIYARIVTLGFDLPTLSVSETRLVLNEIADASRRLSTMVNSLVPDKSAAPANGSTVGTPTSSV
jgi:signal transduction histidine kinase